MRKQERNSSQKATVTRIIRYIGRYRIYLYLSLILAVVTVLLTLYIPKLTGRSVDYMIGKGKVDFYGVRESYIKSSAVQRSRAPASG